MAQPELGVNSRCHLVDGIDVGDIAAVAFGSRLNLVAMKPVALTRCSPVFA